MQGVQPSCFAPARAAPRRRTQRNRSGSSATTAAVAGSRNSVHTHRVCCHRSSDTLSACPPSSPWKTVGGQRVSHAPSAREVIDGASGLVPTRGTQVRISRIRTSKVGTRETIVPFFLFTRGLETFEVARIVIQSCVNHSPRSSPPPRPPASPPSPPLAFSAAFRDRHRVPLRRGRRRRREALRQRHRAHDAPTAAPRIRRKRERCLLHAPRASPPRRRRSGTGRGSPHWRSRGRRKPRSRSPGAQNSSRSASTQTR